MKTTAVDQTGSASDVLCDVCNESTSVESHGPQFGTLRANWEFRSPPNGERYEIHLCERCFFSVLAGLRRTRLLNTMLSDGWEDLSNFGRVAGNDLQCSRQSQPLGRSSSISSPSSSLQALAGAFAEIGARSVAIFSRFKRSEKRNEIVESLFAVRTVRIVGRGGLQQDPSEIYESENYKKAQRDAHLIVNR
jgi:hypothetical protein